MATSTGGLRYPVSGSAPNIPQDIQNLATDVDLKVKLSVANAAARTSLQASIAEGCLVEDKDTKKLWLKGSTSSSWTYVWGPPGTAVTSTPAATGFTINELTLRSAGNGMARIYINVDRTGGTITVPGDGNVVNTVIYSLSAPWRPLETSPLSTLTAGSASVGYLQAATGNIVLVATTSGTTIPNGYTFDLAGWYMLADPSAV